MLTRRCTQRQYLLRPDEETNNAFIYCLAEAARRFGIIVLLPVAEANHHHTVFFDPHGNYPRFVEHFHKMAARCLNARWGRWENFWASGEPCITTLLDVDTVIEKLAYAATNPVKDMLVERVHHWPGVNGYINLVTGRVLRARRPRFFFDPDGDMPEEVTLELKIPAELGIASEIICELEERVIQIEKNVLAERKRTGRSIVGRRAIKALSWRSRPRSKEPRRTLRPRFAGRKHNRIAAIEGFREFLAAYREARREWLARRSATFPVGTYWLARFTPLPLAIEKQN